MSNSSASPAAVVEAAPTKDETGTPVPSSQNSRLSVILAHALVLVTQFADTASVVLNSLNNYSKHQSSCVVSPAQDGQATASRMRNLSAWIRTIRTFEATREVAHKREAIRMPRMHKMLCASGLAPAPSAEAPPDNNPFLSSSQSP
jgi:hypothetical protein